MFVHVSQDVDIIQCTEILLSTKCMKTKYNAIICLVLNVILFILLGNVSKILYKGQITV